jgi:hypothetical protein
MVMTGIASRWLPMVAGTGLALVTLCGCGQEPPARVDTGPGGTAAVLINPDGTGAATYRPARLVDEIQGVEFWLRRPGGGWERAGVAPDQSGGVYSTARLEGTQRPGWSETGAALSIHVAMADGTRVVDPVPWVWSDEFEPPPSASPTAVAVATATPVATDRARSGLPRGPTPVPVPTQDPFPAATAAGATAVCTDGTWSFAHGGDVCTRHGAVLWWTGRFGPAGPGGVGDPR